MRLAAHIPRRPYAQALPGISTIRVFEALACGVALICSPWRSQVLIADSGEAVAALLEDLTERNARSIGHAARQRVLAEHTYEKRAMQVTEFLTQCRKSTHHAEVRS